MKKLQGVGVVVSFVLLGSVVAWGQVETVGRIVGTVADPTGAVVPGARIQLTHLATGANFSATSSADGGYVVPQLRPGIYRIEVTAQGFRRAVITDVAVEVGRTATVKVRLEVGPVAEVVEVVGGAEVIETQETTITSVVKGPQITQLPLTGRDALDLALLMPGVVTPGRPRTSSVMGLPKGAINMTMDGLNIQSNLLKSSDGFFALIQPRLDAIEEFSISTSTPGAEAAGEGAVQIRFVTKSGTKDYHGGVFWYHLNPVMHANPWFDNAFGSEPERMLRNTFGGSIGGPILKEKLFFFFSIDNFRLPRAISRTRTLLTDEAFSGVFRYDGTDGVQRTVDLLALAGANGFTSTSDPFLSGIFSQLSAARSVSQPIPVSPRADEIRFTNRAKSDWRFPMLRLDWNVNPKHQWTGWYHFNWFSSSPDTLNSQDPTFPGFPLQGGQFSNRRFAGTALRSTLTPSITNEFRIGFQSASVNFFGDKDLSLYPTVPGLGVVRPDFPSALMDDPFLGPGQSWRNLPTTQMYDNVAIVHGKHNLKFGWAFTHVYGYYTDTEFFSGLASVNDVDFGVLTTDPAETGPNAFFNTTNFPAIRTEDLSEARALYALVTGRISGASGGIYANPRTRQYEPNFPYHSRWHQREMGFYGTDSWRVSPSLTLNYGLRWELSFGPINDNNYWGYGGGEVGAFGISGLGNLFKPGTLTGTPTTYDLLNGRRIWANDFDNLAPSFGFAWNPGYTEGFLGKLLGDHKTVIRSGYSFAYTREGQNHVLSMIGANPGPWAIASLKADVEFPAGSLLLRNPAPSPTLFPSSYTFPMSARDFLFEAFGPNETARDIQIPYVQSWSFGIQRELTQNTVLEVRYDGNHAIGLWRQVDLNEINIFENGFLNEFLAAQNNLAICRADPAACQAAGSGTSTGNSYGFWGLPGQVPLPIMSGAFGSPTSSSFRSGSFVTRLDDGNVGDFARLLAGSFTRFCNLIGGGTPEYGPLCSTLGITSNAGFPLNFWMVNPDSEFGGVFFLDNGSYSNYHGLTVHLRRRMAGGVMYDFNYVFSKSLTDLYTVSSTSFRAKRSNRLAAQQDRGLSAYDIRHVFKANWIYEFPFGPGRRWAGESGVLNRFIEGWAFHGIGRVQSGRPFLLNGGRFTFNRYLVTSFAVDSGVELIGITRQELEKAITVRKEGNGQVFYLPSQFIGSDGRPNPAFIRPCSTPGQFCPRVFLHGPWFSMFDFSVVKKTKITERVGTEFRFEFLNAFNHPNFMVGSPNSNIIINDSEVTATSTLFGRMRDTWQDRSTTQHLGSRMIQFVFRINF